MTIPSAPQHAYLILDNSFLAWLHESYCHQIRAAAPQVVQGVTGWAAEKLNTLKRFTPDQCLHISAAVSDEFILRAGLLSNIRGITRDNFRTIESRCRSLLTVSEVPAAHIQLLQRIAGNHGHFRRWALQSSNDLSLVALALTLTNNQQDVYIVTNDRDLLDFISWIRSQHTVGDEWPNRRHLNARPALQHMGFIHRGCSCSSEDMSTMVKYSLVADMKRSSQVREDKREVMANQLYEAIDFMRESDIQKMARRMALQ